ncbi:MAG: nucleotidyltransferase family protein [Bacteroidales bacterium]|nr:nucleotidyltransferase family protein [Bacteroidales bacterium]
MMTPTESQYFALLRAALWAQPVSMSEPIDWKGIMRIANHHGNTALLSDVATRMTGDNSPGAKMQAKMRDSMRSNLVHQMNLKSILISVVQNFRQHGVEPVLLKGFGLAMLYPNPSLRQFGDIDLFVGLGQFHEACALVREMPGCYNWGMEVDVGRHYNVDFGPYPMEIHRVSADVIDEEENKTYAAIEQDGLFDNARKVDWEGFELSVPSKEFMVFFTFFHAWHHFLTSGVGLRQLSDVAMALHAYAGEMDLNKLHSWIAGMHLTEPWQAFGSLMVEHIGLSQAEMPFYTDKCGRTAQKLYKRIMEEGNFRRDLKFKKRRPKRRVWQKLHSFINTFVDYFHIARIFPKQARRELKASLSYAWAKMWKNKGRTDN